MCVHIYIITEGTFVNYSREQQYKGNEDVLINLEGVQFLHRL